MHSNNNHNNDLGKQISRLDQKKVAKIEEWRNEHGQPDFEFLQSLAEEGTIDSLEKLKSVAEDLDVWFDSNVLPGELVDRIRSAVAQNGNDDLPTT